VDAQPAVLVGRLRPATRGAGYFALAVLLAALAAAMGVALSKHPLSSSLVFAFGLGLLGILALTLTRYALAVTLGVLLLAVVWVEPAPPDLVFAVVIAVALAGGTFRTTRVPVEVLALLAGFLALNMFASIEVVDVARAMLFFSITLYLGIFAVWLAAYVDSTDRARLIVNAYIFAAVVSAAAATLALFLSFPGQELLVRGPRAKALFKDPNVFGAFLVPAALILLEEVTTPRLLRLRPITKTIALSVVTLGILFSFSRAAWLNVGVGALVMFLVLALRRGGGKRAMILLAVVLTAAAAVFVSVTLTSSVSFLQERVGFQPYDVQRFGGQLSGIELAVQYPLGIGPGQFEQVLPISAHSTYVRALAEEGLLGLLLLLGLALVTLFFAARNVGAGRDTYGIGSAALLGAWCGLLANSVFIDTLHWRHFWLVAALIWAGAARSAIRPGRSAWARPESPPRPTRAA
jgi:O-antigen ligase